MIQLQRELTTVRGQNGYQRRGAGWGGDLSGDLSGASTWVTAIPPRYSRPTLVVVVRPQVLEQPVSREVLHVVLICDVALTLQPLPQHLHQAHLLGGDVGDGTRVPLSWLHQLVCGSVRLQGLLLPRGEPGADCAGGGMWPGTVSNACVRINYTNNNLTNKSKKI